MTVSTTVFSGAGYSLKIGAENNPNSKKIINFYQSNIKSSVYSDVVIKQPQIAGAMTQNSCLIEADMKLNNTNSLVDYLYQQGEDYSFSHRASLAAQYQIVNYSGSTEQNILLLNKLKERQSACN